MKEVNKRSLFRWIHVICGVPIVGYIYDSPSDTPYYAHSIRYGFLPVLAFSGLWMWKGCVLRRMVSRSLAKSPVELSRHPTRINPSKSTDESALE